MESVALTSGVSIDTKAVAYNIKRIINQVYKLLPLREQGENWQKPLQMVIEQLEGMKSIIKGQDELFFRLLCKLEGLFSLKDKTKDLLYRSVIFECLNLLTCLKANFYA